MALGFSVEDLLPHARVSGPVRMGLVPVGVEEWLDPAPEPGRRAQAFDAYPDSVLALPEAMPAIAELAEMLGQDCSGGIGALEACGRSHWEDFCLLVRVHRGARYHLAAGALAFPTDWHLSQKLGGDLGAVHAPIHGYAGRVEQGVARFIDSLEPDRIFGRANVFVQPSGDLRYLPGPEKQSLYAHVTPENAGQTLWIRCERQTLRRLPQSDAIVFAIGIYLAPLASLDNAVIERLAGSLSGFGAGELDRRAAPLYAQGLNAYAQARKRRAGAHERTGN